MRCLALGYLNTQLGGAGERTSNPPVTSRPALPPDPHAVVFSLVAHGHRLMTRQGVGTKRLVLCCVQDEASQCFQQLGHKHTWAPLPGARRGEVWGLCGDSTSRPFPQGFTLAFCYSAFISVYLEEITAL